MPHDIKEPCGDHLLHDVVVGLIYGVHVLSHPFLLVVVEPPGVDHVDTADEIVEFASPFIKGEAKNIFDFDFYELPSVDFDLDLNDLSEVKELFSEEIDRLKKEKLIKATLELDLVARGFDWKLSSLRDVEDWFVVSGIKEESEGEQLGFFEFKGISFAIKRATKHKCPRCWKFVSENEEQICARCSEVVDV